MGSRHRPRPRVTGELPAPAGVLTIDTHANGSHGPSTNQNSGANMSDLVGPGFISITVSDVPRSARFYEQHLDARRDPYDFGPSAVAFLGWPAFSVSAPRPGQPGPSPDATTIALWWRSADARAHHERTRPRACPSSANPSTARSDGRSRWPIRTATRSPSTSATNRCSGRQSPDTKDQPPEKRLRNGRCAAPPSQHASETRPPPRRLLQRHRVLSRKGIRLWVNGEPRPDSRTAAMVYDTAGEDLAGVMSSSRATWSPRAPQRARLLAARRPPTCGPATWCPRRSKVSARPWRHRSRRE
jgi:hypothetical protein